MPPGNAVKQVFYFFFDFIHLIVFRYCKCTNNAVGGKVSPEEFVSSSAEYGILLYFLSCLITSLKLPHALSKFSAVSSANTSGSGRLSRSARDLSFSPVMAKDVLSRQ
jgi:hypothetical protein